MKISYFKMFAIWFTVGVVLTYVFCSIAILPGFNMPTCNTYSFDNISIRTFNYVFLDHVDIYNGTRRS